jgi:benzoate membrane transport protein
MFTSWGWGISIGPGVAGIVLSWTLRAPVIAAWSAPGTALLITLFPRLPLAEAVGAYLTAAVILLVVGLSGSLERIMTRVPGGIAGGMMAGILLPFGVRTATQHSCRVPRLIKYATGKFILKNFPDEIS